VGESSIAWTDYTFNPWWGCAEVSPGCANCYARTFDRRVGGKRWGLRSPRRFFGEKHWNEPLTWNRRRRGDDPRHRVFCSSMADLFERHPEPDMRAAQNEARARTCELIEATPLLDWQLLTKRPENVLEMVPERWRSGFPPNVWMLTTAENQAMADRRIPELLKIPARVRGASVEPMLGPVDLTEWFYRCDGDCLRPDLPHGEPILDWVIVGGESGPRRRPFELAWLEAIAAQCDDAGTALFVKQDAGPYPGQQGRIPAALWARKEFPRG
jgi:protein gp37